MLVNLIKSPEISPKIIPVVLHTLAICFLVDFLRQNFFPLKIFDRNKAK